ncbi:MAG: hypothetical protein M3539_01735 [Acidobacteriota bacterium]|nr:hypothetical protein [Acidobacteriota bacterium]
MDLNWLLLLLCSLAGLIMVIGSLYLLWRGRIDLRDETKGSTKFKFLGFEMETPVAGLIMFVMGVVMLYIPIYYSPKMCVDLAFHQKKPLEMVDLRGKVSTDTNIKVFAIVDEQEANADQTIALSVPYLVDRRYVVRYFNKAGEKVDEETFRLGKDDKVYELRGVRERGAAAAASPTPAIKLEQQESSGAVAEFTSR